MMKKILAAIGLCIVVLSGCYNDNFKELYPGANLNAGCDTASSVTYNKQISSIMSGYCISCHATGASNGGIVLDNYTGTTNATQSGKLLPSIQHQSGHPAMPPNSQLDACSIREVELWIQNNYAQ